MSKRAGETTIKTSIRIRPWSQQERETFPGPSPVQAAPGEVRLFQRPFIPAGGRASPSSLLRSPRPGTPTSPHVTPRGPSSPSMVWRQQAAAQLGNDYQSYPFANVFGPEDGNEDVYDGSGCKDVVGSVLSGCNGTIFVYGQTGAGKTFTMDAVTDLVLQQLFAAADDSSSEVAISVSAVELYNEVLRCLLSGRENLQLRWASGAGSVNGVVLEGAEERPCGSIEEAAALVTMAKASRAVGETRANARSSRSHLIVRIKVEVLQLSNLTALSPSPTAGSSPRRISLAASKSMKAPPATVTFSMLNLVDLAGSERIDKTGSSDTPLRLREALNINKSLLCLGNVVTALAERAEGKRSSHIPYRDSKLTRLLEDSLGGNATTALIACITPLPDWNLEQSRNTLEFAARAARILCKPQRNVLNLAPSGAASGDAANIIASLQAEVEALKKQLAEHQHQLSPQPPQLHALPVQPISSSNALWDGCSLLSSRGSALAGVAESTAESGEQDMENRSPSPSPSPGTASCPPSPSGRLSPLYRGRSGGWTNRLRMSLGGSSSGGNESTARAVSPEMKLSTARSLQQMPSRIPSPKHSLFSSLSSPRGGSKVPTLAAAIDRSASDSSAATIQTHPAQPAAAEAANSIQGGLPVSAHTTSIISRASGTQKSLLWKLLQQPHPHDRQPCSQPCALERINSSGGGTGSSCSRSSHGTPPATQSLQSTGLLITSSGNAATAAAAVAANAVGVFARWATFSGSRSSPISTGTYTTAPERAETADGGIPCHPVLLSPQPSLLNTGRSSIASRRLTVDGTTGNSSLLASGAGKAALDSAATNPNLESRVAAAEAAMALRDHIIKQLVSALQQKKAEIRSLKEQMAVVLKQLESSEGEEQANKEKLRELAEGIQMLAAARQEEFEKWKGHLVGLEAALQTAQKEATNYRDESQTLVQQLTALQARYDSLETEKRNSLLNISVVQSALAQNSVLNHQQQEQLEGCLQRLHGIEGALQDILRAQGEALPTPRSSRACTPRRRGSALSPRPHHSLRRSPSPSGSISRIPPLFPLAFSTSVDQESAKAGKGEIASHCIHTLTTRVYDAGHGLLATAQQPSGSAMASLTEAAEEAANAARLSHIEFVLAELQELMPLVKAAADAAVSQAHANRAAAAVASGQGVSVVHALSTLGSLPRLSMLQTGSTADNAEGKQQDQAAQTKEAKASIAGTGLVNPGKCHKCDSLKPLLVIMQKLKDEVVLLKAAVRSRDAKVADAEQAAVDLKADLLESKQQVGALRERIDELSEDLELARTAAAAAAAAAAADEQHTAAPAEHASKEAAATDSSRPQSPGRELSRRELSRHEQSACRQVPLMGEDTPLEALHTQILQSWQALAMPFAFRCAFVLGFSNSGSSDASSNGSSSNSVESTAQNSSGTGFSSQAGCGLSSSTESSSTGSASGSDTSSSNSSSSSAPAGDAVAADVQGGPWRDRSQCQAHVALLACLHQYQEDEPNAARQQQEVLQHEARVIEAGLALLPQEELKQLLQHWGIQADAACEAQRAALRAKLWSPCSLTAAEALAVDSAAACQRALRAAPPADLAAVSLRCNASIIAAASNALADAAS